MSGRSLELKDYTAEVKEGRKGGSWTFKLQSPHSVVSNHSRQLYSSHNTHCCALFVRSILTLFDKLISMKTCLHAAKTWILG